MSTPDLPQRLGGKAPPGNRWNTWTLALIVAAVLAIPAICVCGAVGVAFWSWQTPGRPIDVQVGPPPEVVRSPAPELRPIEAVPHPAPKPPPPVLEPRPGPKSPLPKADSLREPEPGAIKPAVESRDGKRTLFTLKPFTEDKASMPADTRVNFEAIDREGQSTAAVTLLQFYPDRDPQLRDDSSFATGFRITARVPWPTSGAVSFLVRGVGAQTSVDVSIDENSVWTYQGGPEDSVASPPAPLARKQNEAKTFELSLAVGGGGRGAISGIQSFSVYEEPVVR